MHLLYHWRISIPLEMALETALLIERWMAPLHPFHWACPFLSLGQIRSWYLWVLYACPMDTVWLVYIHRLTTMDTFRSIQQSVLLIHGDFLSSLHSLPHIGQMRTPDQKMVQCGTGRPQARQTGKGLRERSGLSSWRPTDSFHAWSSSPLGTTLDITACILIR